MKRISALLSIFLLCAAFWSVASVSDAQAAGGFTDTAQSQDKGGYSGSGPAVMPVKQALEMRDGAMVTLKGNIVQHLGGDKYLFRDATGSIWVEIDDDEWNGQTIGPEDAIELHGEVDRDWNALK